MQAGVARTQSWSESIFKVGGGQQVEKNGAPEDTWRRKLQNKQIW